MNRCEYDVLNNLQHKKKYLEYNFNNVEAYSDIGKERKRQEDGVLITTHVADNDFRMIAIADGMGGEKGSFASNIMLYNLLNWFQNLSVSYYLEKTNIDDGLMPIIYKTDKEIRSKYQTAGTTITLAIKCVNSTYTLNIGDTRIYLQNNYKLEQISTDHNIAWELYKKGDIKTKDDIRFHKKSNLLTARVGCEKELIKISKEIVSNNDYNNVYIFSDGITDCLSDYELNLAANKSTKDILISALNNKSYNYKLNDDYYDTIEGGKDNSSIAVLNRVKRG